MFNLFPVNKKTSVDLIYKFKGVVCPKRKLVENALTLRPLEM